MQATQEIRRYAPGSRIAIHSRLRILHRLVRRIVRSKLVQIVKEYRHVG